VSDFKFALEFSVDADNNPIFVWSPVCLSVRNSPTSTAKSIEIILELPHGGTAKFATGPLWSSVHSRLPSIGRPASMSAPEFDFQKKKITFSDTGNPSNGSQVYSFRVAVEYTHLTSHETYYYLSPDPVIINEPA
jgi:hypothetical protein